MHRKTGHQQTAQKPNPHPAMTVFKKCGHFSPTDANPNRKVTSARSAGPNFQNILAKNKSDVSYKHPCPHVNRNNTNVGRNTTRANSPTKPMSMIYKRCDHVYNHSWNNNNQKNVALGSFNGIQGHRISSPEVCKKCMHVKNTNKIHSCQNCGQNKAVNAQNVHLVKKQPVQPQAVNPPVTQQKNTATAAPNKNNNVVKSSSNTEKNDENMNTTSTNKNNNAAKSAPAGKTNNPAPAQKEKNENTENINTVSTNKNNNAAKSAPAGKTNNPPPAQKNSNAAETNKKPKENVKTKRKILTEPQPDPSNLSFQKVTRELGNIIKNFQRQIQDVPITRAKVEQVPSAMIEPKIKIFFKNTKLESPSELDASPASKQDPGKTPTNKTQQNESLNKTGNNPIPTKNSKIFDKITKKSSLKTLSGSSISSKGGDLRRFRSFTHPTLKMKSSNSSNRRMSHHSSSFLVDPLKVLKEEVQKAIREKKTFTVRGHYKAVRNALLSRGWVEKFHITYKDQLKDELKRYQNYTISELLPLMKKEDLSTVCKNIIKSKLLGGYQVDFYWGTNDQAFKENPDKVKHTLINKLKREIFSYTNKQGLCDASKNSYWYQKRNVSKLNHPRSYSLGKNGDVKGFIDDFHITAAMSLLKWIVKINSSKECKLMSPTGKVPIETFDFALNECCKFIKRSRHEDIDMKIPDATEHEWTTFLSYFYKLVHYNNHFLKEGKENEDALVRKSNYILNNLRSFYPYVDMDGMMNIWILKPTASSRGRGIHMCRTLQYILKTIKQNPNTRYIIQKYIERPLLIYNTKFDIRQWFLISNCSPLTIWMYKECYLRFSSQTYNLRKLHESIHLTNNSVQCKYKNTSLDAALPSYNMWDSSEFQKYLSNIGYPNAFKDVIYSGMKQCITAAVLMHQDKMVVRKNCFELYGADFILSEDFQPWLLEINSNPALYGSTPVTARMCPKVLEDVIKVVVDYQQNNKANTGSFEMIYREQLSKLPASASFEVVGVPLQRSYFCNDPDKEVQETVALEPYNNVTNAADSSQSSLKVFGEEIKKTLKNLLQIIQNEKLKRGLEKRQNQTLAAPATKVS